MKTILFTTFIHIFHLYLLIFIKCDDQLSSTNQKISVLKDWERVPLANGTFVWVHRLQIEQYLKNTAFSTIQDDGLSRIFFKLYTNSNPTVGQDLKIGNKYLVSKSNFNPKHPTRIIIHGWVSHIDSPVNKLIRKAYLTRGAYNVICMDWNSIASRVNYIGVRYSLESVSHVLSRFILFLHQKAGMPIESVYLIGHSLGAHLAGFAGKLLEKNKINTIIGLDPAGPLFTFNQTNERLFFNDAEYVETIHTDITNFGFSGPIGHASFYPNNGKNQPGCWSNIFACSHARAFKYFAESIQYVNNMFMPSRCWDIFNSTFSNKTCSKYINTIRMGGDPSNQLKNIGIYFLPTSSKSPFAIGNLYESI